MKRDRNPGFYPNYNQGPNPYINPNMGPGPYQLPPNQVPMQYNEPYMVDDYNMEARISRIERQIRKIDNRLSKLENKADLNNDIDDISSSSNMYMI